MIRVLIVDDSVTQREIFGRLLANDPELAVVAEARHGREAIEQVRAHAPDVVLMDIHMPDPPDSRPAVAPTTNRPAGFATGGRSSNK